jgi:hypothetical protein
MTDADGDVSFELPLGEYVAIVSADGYVTATEEFILDEEGEIEVNEVNLTDIDDVIVPTGNLVKALLITDFELVDAINLGTASLQTEVLFCQGVITDPADCNELTDAAVVTAGGFDDYQGVPFFTFPDIDLDDLLQEFGIFLFAAQVPVGDYTICTGVEVTWDDDGDPLTPPVNYDAGFNCENESSLQAVGTDLADFELAEGQITVYEDETTIVVNVFSSVDVFVYDSTGGVATPILGAEVCLYEDAAMTILIGCQFTDADLTAGTLDDGWARFFFVGDLFDTTTLTSSASAAGFDNESFTFEYSLLGDLLGDGELVDTDPAFADSLHGLDPN